MIRYACICKVQRFHSDLLINQDVYYGAIFVKTNKARPTINTDLLEHKTDNYDNYADAYIALEDFLNECNINLIIGGK